jgi:signal transduction histidine kinase
MPLREIEALKQAKDYDYLRKDIFQLLNESKDGLARLRKIVQDLKNFSHVDDAEWCWADLHKGLDSTLNIVWNELKYKCKVTKAYGQLPEVYCLPAQLNQVFMNLFVNAGQAIEEKGEIKIRTGVDSENSGEVWIEVSDTGKGIPKASLNRIFEPFYTTKPIGQGTGLGLSLSYSIVNKHQGRITVDSVVGVGTTFRVTLPIQPNVNAVSAAEKV